MRSDLGKLTDDWKGIDTIILYGAGTVARICEELFKKVNIHIACVIDNDITKQGKMWNNAPIVSFRDAREYLNKYKIVVMTAHAAFNEISQNLEQEGLIEFKDYCRLGQFICEWFWNEKRMNCIFHVDMTVTTYCTLNCKNCNMFIPYYNRHEHYSFEQLKENIDLLFARVDYVVYFGLIGGEPLTNPDLEKVIRYLEENYRDKFGKISFASNGTVIPNKDLLDTMKKYNVHIVVSDYSSAIPYKNKINNLKNIFDEFGIAYDMKPEIEWCDFGFPDKPFKRNESELKKHLDACRPEWNGLNDGKFYYCNVSWSAEKSGRFKLGKEDYIVLKDIDPSDKVACHALSELSRGTSTFCRICGGCGKDNTNYVPTGVQL